METPLSTWITPDSSTTMNNNEREDEARDSGNMTGDEPETRAENGNPLREGDHAAPQSKEEQGRAGDEEHQPGGENHQPGGENHHQPGEEENHGPGEEEPHQPEEAPETRDEIENAPVDEEEEEQDPQPAEPVRPCCCSSLLSPLNRAELKELAFQGTQLYVTNSTPFFLAFVSVAFSGQIGSDAFMSAALAIAAFNLFAVTVGTVLADACISLISQTCGRGRRKRVGVLLLRAVLFMLLACSPCMIFLLYMEMYVLVFSRDPDCARLAQQYSYILMGAVPPCFLYHLQVRFLQHKNIIWPVVAVGILVNVLHIIFCALFAVYLQRSFLSTAGMCTVSYTLLALLLALYIKYSGVLKSAWPSRPLDVLQEWCDLFVKALIRFCQLSVEFWMYDLYLFLTSRTSALNLQVQIVMTYMYLAALMASLGLSAAVTVRIRKGLDAGDVDKNKRTTTVALLFGLMFAVLLGAFVILVRSKVAKLFTKDQKVVETVVNYFWHFWLTVAVDSIMNVIGGVIRGARKVNTLTKCSLVCRGLGIIISIIVMHYSNLGLFGLWIGINVGIAGQFCSLGFVLLTLDWQREVENALARAALVRGIEMVNTGDGAADGPDAQAAQDEDDSEDEGPVVLTFLSTQQLCLRRGLVVMLLVAFVVVAGVFRNSIIEKILKEGEFTGGN